MRRFIHNEPRDEYGRADAEICTTEAYICRYYWWWWRVLAWRRGIPIAEITFDACVEDWMIIHWAREIKDG